MYDIIGDIHGHYNLLVKLLETLGYEQNKYGWSHPERKVVFTGDIINRGPEILESVRLVKSMVENGQAYCVMGNHELNAIIYATHDKTGKLLRKRLPRYKLPLMKTLDEFKKHEEEFDEMIKWFRHLPLYLELEGIRVVHGAWNDDYIEVFEKYREGESKLKKSFLKAYLKNDELNKAVNGLIKGESLKLPKDLLIKDNKGIIRREFRVKWWEAPKDKTFKEMAFGNRFELPAYTMPKEIYPELYPYPSDAPPVFLGHYCLKDKENIYQGNICCIDTCVVRSQQLSCYRWNGEKTLDKNNLLQV